MEGGGGNANLVVAPGITGAVTAAVRSDAVSAAAVTQDRTTLVVAPLSENASRTVATGIGLRRPDFDRQGFLWVNDDQDTGRSRSRTTRGCNSTRQRWGRGRLRRFGSRPMAYG
ncbi:LpqB family beta-propeller domain-containing protein [Propioniciclava flava]